MNFFYLSYKSSINLSIQQGITCHIHEDDFNVGHQTQDDKLTDGKKDLQVVEGKVTFPSTTCKSFLKLSRFSMCFSYSSQSSQVLL